MSASLPYKMGETVVICQRSGRACYASEILREFDGTLVYFKYFEDRHPQELRRNRPERAPMPPLNPEPPDTFVDTFLDFIIVENAPENEISLLMWEDNSLIGWG